MMRSPIECAIRPAIVVLVATNHDPRLHPTGGGHMVRPRIRQEASSFLQYSYIQGQFSQTIRTKPDLNFCAASYYHS